MRDVLNIRAVSLLCLAFLAGCAAPQVTAPPPGPAAPAVIPAASPAPSAPEVPLPAEKPDPLTLIGDDPAVAAATASLAAASPAARPAALMRRARESFAAARKLSAEKGGPFGAVWLTDHERFLAYCELALRDLEELLTAHPSAPEAAEAIFTVGRIRDYPNLNLFDEALAAYRLTIERHPGTPWARQAAERVALIEGMTDSLRGGPHGAPAHEPGR